MNTCAERLLVLPDDERSASIAARKISSWRDLETLSLKFHSVLHDSGGATIFSTLEWLGAWWRACGQGKQLFSFYFSDLSGEVLGFAPLYMEQVRSRGLAGIRRLRLVGDGTQDSDNLDLIVRSGNEAACAQALLDQLESESAWDVCELNTLGVESKMGGAILKSLTKRGWPLQRSERPGSIVPLPDDWEAYVRQLSHEHASGIERYTRRLARHYAVRIRRCTSEAELDSWLETLFDLHQKRWQTRGQLGSFANPERRRFYSEMSRSFLRNGWLEFGLLQLDGRPAAAQFAFRYGNTVYQLQEGVDPRHYTDRAGIVLRAHILKTLIAEGVREYDFLGGTDPHKKSWGAQSRPYTDICFAKPRSLGAVHISLNRHSRMAKGWFRSHLPAPVVRLLGGSA